jgi:uncharacterized phiE125 gp8 family phage protein
MMLVEEEAGALAVGLAELKAYLRIENANEDAVLASLLRGAAGLCEQFVGQWLTIRAARETVAADGTWRRLAARPVVEIGTVEGLDGDGTAVALPVAGYAIDIDAQGEGWVRGAPVDGVQRLRVTYRAGLADDPNGVPEAIRQGIVRMAAETYATREGRDPVAPAAVTALWRPWRRMRLS